MTYKEAESLIIDAYFKNEIRPFDESFCFCGTLSPNCRWYRQSWFDRLFNTYPYSYDEYAKMEYYFFRPFSKIGIKLIDVAVTNASLPYGFEYTDEYEELVFEGMRNALDVLKEIHRNRGENLGEEKVFKKRFAAINYQNNLQ